MAKLTSTRHDSVKRTITALFGKGLISQPQIVDGPKSANGVATTAYTFNKRDSFVVVARLSPEFTAAIVDRWQDLEKKETPEQLMARALISAQSVIDDKNKQLEQAKPAIELHESIVNDESTLCLRDAGKKLQVKPNKFIEWLRDEKHLTPSNMAYQSKINAGYMLLSTTEHNGKPRTNTRITGKGFAHFGKKLAELRFKNPDHAMFYKG